MISNTKESSNVFFACCYRDDDVQDGGRFSSWLASIKVYPLEVITIGNISTEGVNEMVSETLHLSPRITRPLASILHQKTRGNPVSHEITSHIHVRYALVFIYTSFLFLIAVFEAAVRVFERSRLYIPELQSSAMVLGHREDCEL